MFCEDHPMSLWFVDSVGAVEEQSDGDLIKVIEEMLRS
jgi:hypothetical protein